MSCAERRKILLKKTSNKQLKLDQSPLFEIENKNNQESYNRFNKHYSIILL